MPKLDSIVYVKTPKSGIRNHVEDRFIAKHGGFEFIGRDYGSDEYVLVEMFLEDTYGWLSRPVSNGVVIDIGANIGAFTVPAAGRANRVIAYEPEANNLAYLKANMQLNGYSFEIRPYAVGEPNTTATISNHNGGSVLNKWMSHNGKQEVLVVGLDDVVTEEVDFLKMDCEGGEYDAFKFASPATLKRIKRFAMESHPQLVSKEEHALLLKLLEDYFHINQAHGSRIFGTRK